MKKTNTLAFAICFALTYPIAPAVMGMSLEDAYLASLSYDADLLMAKAARMDLESGVGVARSALLPQITYSAQRNRADTYTDYVDTRLKDFDMGTYSSKSSGVSLRQPIFRKPAWDALTVAQKQAAAADADYMKETQNAALRVVTAYLDVLFKRVVATLASKQTEATEGWLNTAERMFLAGHGTRTDIADARSRRDIARANEQEAYITLEAAARTLEVVTGESAEKIPEIDPLSLNPERFPLSDLNGWLQRTEADSPEIQSLGQQLAAAGSYVDQMRAGHFPTLDLVAGTSRSLNDTPTSLSTPAQYTTRYVGLQLNLPILNGGGVFAQTDQALARREKVQQALESTRRKTIAESKRLFLLLNQGKDLVNAHREAIRSAQSAVEGQKKGMLAGTRTFVDVLDAEKRLYEAKRDHAAAVYSLINNRFKLLALAGAIDQENIHTASRWLSSAK